MSDSSLNIRVDLSQARAEFARTMEYLKTQAAALEAQGGGGALASNVAFAGAQAKEAGIISIPGATAAEQAKALQAMSVAAVRVTTGLDIYAAELSQVAQLQNANKTSLVLLEAADKELLQSEVTLATAQNSRTAALVAQQTLDKEYLASTISVATEQAQQAAALTQQKVGSEAYLRAQAEGTLTQLQLAEAQQAAVKQLAAERGIVLPGAASGAGIGGALVQTAGILGLSVGIKDVVQSGLALQKVFAQLEIQLQHLPATAQIPLAQIKQQVDAISVSTGTAAPAIAGVIGQLLGFTQNAKQALQDANDAAQIAKVTGQTVGTTTNQLVPTASAFGQSFNAIAGQAQTVRDFFGVDPAKILQFFSSAAPLTKTFGVSLQELGAIGGTALKNINISAQQVGEDLNRVFPNIQKNVANIADEFRAAPGGAGRTAADLFVSQVGAGQQGQALETLITNFNKLNEAQKENVEVLLGSQRGAKEFAPILQQQGDFFKYIANNIDPVVREQKAWQAQQSTLMQQLSELGQLLLKTGREVFQDGLGQALIDLVGILSGAAHVIDDVAGIIHKLDDVSGGAVGKVAGLTLAVLALQKAMSLLAATSVGEALGAGGIGAIAGLEGGVAASTLVVPQVAAAVVAYIAANKAGSALGDALGTEPSKSIGIADAFRVHPAGTDWQHLGLGDLAASLGLAGRPGIQTQVSAVNPFQNASGFVGLAGSSLIDDASIQAAVQAYQDGTGSFADALKALEDGLKEAKASQVQSRIKTATDQLNKTISDSILKNQELADSLGGNTAGDYAARITQEVATFKLPEFNNQADRLAEAKKVVENLKAELTAEADTGKTTADRNKILREGLAIPPEVRQVLAQEIVDTDALLQHLLTGAGDLSQKVQDDVRRYVTALVAADKGVGDATVEGLNFAISDVLAAALQGDVAQLGQLSGLETRLKQAIAQRDALNTQSGVAGKVTGGPSSAAKSATPQEIQVALDQLQAAKDSANPVQAAADAQKLADDQLTLAASADDQVGVINAQTAQVKAGQQLALALQQIGISQLELVKAQLSASGNVVDAAKEQVAIIQQQIANAIANKEGTAALNALYAQLAAAQASVTATQISYSENQIQDNLDLQRITVAQAVGELRALESVATTQLQRDEIEKRVRQLLNQTNNLQYNLPTDINLPVLYEARRLNQTPQGVGYSDNRNISIVLNAYNNTDVSAATSQIINAVSARTYNSTASVY